MYECQRYKYKTLTDEQFKQQVTKEGSDFDRLLYYYNLHKTFEEKVINELKSTGATVKVVNRLKYSKGLIDWADIVMPLGGDGTFLLAASQIRDNKKAVIGFNSDPNKSEGYLCLPKQYSENVREAIDRLQRGDFSWLLRSRIRISLKGQNEFISAKHLHPILYETNIDLCDGEEIKEINNMQVLPILALNEVFIGENMSARVSYLEINLNGSDKVTSTKCSGLCVATGTGSTSWHLSINRIPKDVMTNILNLVEDNTEHCKVLDKSAQITELYNNSLIFRPDDLRLSYTIRDLICGGVWPQPKGIKQQGFCSKLTVKSKCIDACLVVDGGILIPFDNIGTIVLEIHPEDSLRSAILPN
ncbi:hypothetical protein FQA39_LY05039 [Lamprigera yunnana]|nr:hypothetical protein FQA39_LY05039 [Lamprigera yunnana]